MSPLPTAPAEPSRAPVALRLPAELVRIVCKSLPNRDIKNLPLVSRTWRDTAPLRIDRVFISANPRNVEVFNAIANHEVFRTQVTEIVWDDALLYPAAPEREPPYQVWDDVQPDDFRSLPVAEADKRRFWRRSCWENLGEFRAIESYKPIHEYYMLRPEYQARI